MLIAVRSRLSLKQTILALKRLESLGIATTKDGRSWHLTRGGHDDAVSLDARPRKRGRKPLDANAPSPAALRMLACLDRPRRAAELAEMLNVTRQRIHQLTVILHAFDLIRSAEPERPTSVVARKDDPSLLLGHGPERVLSAFPQAGATTPSRIAAATMMQVAKVARTVAFLGTEGLIEKTGTSTFGDLYQLTPAGAAHWQRCETSRRADLPPPPFRSDRISGVLTYLETNGPTRTRDIGIELGMAQPSINALMQYLKRKKAVATQSDTRFSPYDLTAEGRRMLMVMRQTRQSDTA
jgi:DNA-binding MarR family transcriptional regulator